MLNVDKRIRRTKKRKLSSNNKLTATVALTATVGSTVVGALAPVAPAFAMDIPAGEPADEFVLSGFKSFPYATYLDGLNQFQTPIVSWVDAAALTNGKINDLLTGVPGNHYPMFSEVMQANGKSTYCINPFRLGPTIDEHNSGVNTESTPRNTLGTALFRAAANSYPVVKDVDRDGKSGTTLDKIVSVYTVWLAKGIDGSNYGENLNSGIKWGDIKNRFSNNKGTLGENYGWNLSAYKTLSNSDQAKVKKAIEDNMNRMLKDDREPVKPEISMTQKKTVNDKTGETTVTYTPKLEHGYDHIKGLEMTLSGLSTSQVTVTQNGKEIKPSGSTYNLEDSMKSFTIKVKPQAKATDAKIKLEGTVTDALGANTFDAKDALVQNSMQVEPREAGVSATLTTEVKESLGSLKLKKVDDENKPLKGVEFTLYKDKDCKQKVATKTTDASGNITFDKLPFGTYYLKETKGDSDHFYKAKLLK